jgi:hypothetical protein
MRIIRYQNQQGEAGYAAQRADGTALNLAEDIYHSPVWCGNSSGEKKWPLARRWSAGHSADCGGNESGFFLGSAPRGLDNNPKWSSMKRPCPSLPAQLAGSSRTTVDWDARDELVCGQVVTVALQIKNAPGKPHRVSFATINREIRARLQFYINTKQMPLTRVALKGVLETSEQFALRRIHYVAKSFVAENAPPSRSDLLRAAGINAQRKISGIVMDATDGALPEISCSVENPPTPRSLL